MHGEGKAQDARLEAWVDEVDTWWAAWGIGGGRRTTLREELVADLRQALRDGARVEDLVAEPAEEFARTVASASQVEHSPRAWRPRWRFTVPRLLGGLVVGAALGFVLALLTVYPVGVMWLLDQPGLSYEEEGQVAIVLHGLAAALSLAGALTVVAWAFPRHTCELRTLVVVGAGVLVGGVSSIWPTMRLARALDYSTAWHWVLVEVGLVVALAGLGAALGWWFLRRLPRPQRAVLA